MTEEPAGQPASEDACWLDLPIRPMAADVLAEVFGDEAVVVQLRTGAYYSFDAAATVLWTGAVRGATVGAISSDAADRAGEVPRLLKLVSYLVGEELVEVDGTLPDTGGEQRFPGIEKYTDMEDLLVLDPIHDIDIDGDGWPTVQQPARVSE